MSAAVATGVWWLLESKTELPQECETVLTTRHRNHEQSAPRVPFILQFEGLEAAEINVQRHLGDGQSGSVELCHVRGHQCAVKTCATNTARLRKAVCGEIQNLQ